MDGPKFKVGQKVVAMWESFGENGGLPEYCTIAKVIESGRCEEGYCYEVKEHEDRTFGQGWFAALPEWHELVRFDK